MEEQLAAGTILAYCNRKCTVDNNNGVNAAVAPVREDLVAAGGDRWWHLLLLLGLIGLGNPLALIGRITEKVKGLGSESDDRESVEATSVSGHEDEVVCGCTVRIEGPLDDATV